MHINIGMTVTSLSLQHKHKCNKIVICIHIQLLSASQYWHSTLISVPIPNASIGAFLIYMYFLSAKSPPRASQSALRNPDKTNRNPPEQEELPSRRKPGADLIWVKGK